MSRYSMSKKGELDPIEEEAELEVAEMIETVDSGLFVAVAFVFGMICSNLFSSARQGVLLVFHHHHHPDHRF